MAKWPRSTLGLGRRTVTHGVLGQWQLLGVMSVLCGGPTATVT